MHLTSFFRVSFLKPGGFFYTTMFLRLLALFTLVPALELALLIEIGKEIGFWPTLGIIVLTGIIGSTLTRRQGLAVWKQFNAKLEKGGIPGDELVDGLIILCSGALLLTPGVFTDFVGFLGLIPYSRTFIRSIIQKRLQLNQSAGGFDFGMQFGSTFDATPPPSYSSPEPEATSPEWGGTAKKRPDHTGP